jgi:hypothetical protein
MSMMAFEQQLKESAKAFGGSQFTRDGAGGQRRVCPVQGRIVSEISHSFNRLVRFRRITLLAGDLLLPVA